jgi:hypothetical protein
MKQQQRVPTLSAPTAPPSRDGDDSKTAEIVLFLLDLTRASRNSSLLEIAALAASHLTEALSRRMTYPASPDPSLVHTLSRTTFALAEAWKHHPRRAVSRGGPERYQVPLGHPVGAAGDRS